MKPSILSRQKNLLSRPLVLDGAIGSLLQHNGVISDPQYWSNLANVHSPAIVQKIHEEYIHAGADILSSNTFRSKGYLTSGTNTESERIIKSGLSILSVLRDKYYFIIAGSNGPVEDCYQSERTISPENLQEKHVFTIDSLLKNGSDLIFNETFSHFDEITFVCSYCQKQNIDYVISLYIDENLRLLSGEAISDIIPILKGFSPAAIAFNCMKPEIFLALKNNLKFDFNWGVYLNCGAGNQTDDEITCGVNPEEYFNLIKPIFDHNLSFIGTCCGSTPLHTKYIREKLDELY